MSCPYITAALEGDATDACKQPCAGAACAERGGLVQLFGQAAAEGVPNIHLRKRSIAQPSPLVAMLLSTTIQTCDADRLLQVHGAWGTALADILKKCSTSLTPQGAATPQPSSAAALVVAVSAALRHLFTRCAVLIIIAQISPGQFKAVPGALGWLATIGLFSISCRNWKYTS
eukprot:scaffold4201_cov14-Tisochrysis_lutea.AAC.2